MNETMGSFSIDHNGINNKWRVWSINADGYTVEMLFDSEDAAVRYVEWMESFS